MNTEHDAIPPGTLEEAMAFALGAMKFSIFRLQAQIERLEDAFLAENPMRALPSIDVPEGEAEFLAWADKRGLGR